LPFLALTVAAQTQCSAPRLAFHCFSLRRRAPRIRALAHCGGDSGGGGGGGGGGGSVRLGTAAPLAFTHRVVVRRGGYHTARCLSIRRKVVGDTRWVAWRYSCCIPRRISVTFERREKKDRERERKLRLEQILRRTENLISEHRVVASKGDRGVRAANWLRPRGVAGDSEGEDQEEKVEETSSEG